MRDTSVAVRLSDSDEYGAFERHPSTPSCHSWTLRSARRLSAEGAFSRESLRPHVVMPAKTGQLDPSMWSRLVLGLARDHTRPLTDVERHSLYCLLGE